MSLEDGLKKAASVAIGAAGGPATKIERAFALRHELETSGTTAEAIVITAKPGLYHDYTRRAEGGPLDLVKGMLQSWFLTLRVQPPSQPEFEVDNHEFLSTNSDPWVGAIVPVIFDPSDHSRIVLDERYEAQAAAARRNEPNLPKDLPAERIQQEWTLAHSDEMKQRLGALADVAMSGIGAAAPPPDPAAQLRKLRDLHAAGALTDEEFESARKRVLDQI